MAGLTPARTVTSQVARKSAHKIGPDVALMAKRQPLGLLPSMWFWNRGENARAATIVLLPVLIALQVACVSLNAVLGPLGAGLLAGGGTYLAFGLLERYIRGRCRRRATQRWALTRCPEYVS